MTVTARRAANPDHDRMAAGGRLRLVCCRHRNGDGSAAKSNAGGNDGMDQTTDEAGHAGLSVAAEQGPP
jgi:hypothetical protein